MDIMEMLINYANTAHREVMANLDMCNVYAAFKSSERLYKTFKAIAKSFNQIECALSRDQHIIVPEN